ncbi:SMI1/KNR4 family protein [Rhizobium panacihumi]|uniref:SMI1/KNR4 family protein n=1 Tax=Rhizobium panacihumi TaxID=2008450 RepID=UPI003D79C84E
MVTAKIREAVELVRGHPEAITSQIPLPDESVIQYVEAESGIRLHQDYRYFVQSVGNIALAKELLYLRENREGRLNILRVIDEARQSGVPADWLPICRDNGDYYCLLPDGTVQLWTHDDMFEGRWPDLSEWVIDSFVHGD